MRHTRLCQLALACVATLGCTVLAIAAVIVWAILTDAFGATVLERRARRWA